MKRTAILIMVVMILFSIAGCSSYARDNTLYSKQTQQIPDLDIGQNLNDGEAPQAEQNPQTYQVPLAPEAPQNVQDPQAPQAPLDPRAPLEPLTPENNNTPEPLVNQYPGEDVYEILEEQETADPNTPENNKELREYYLSDGYKEQHSNGTNHPTDNEGFKNGNNDFKFFTPFGPLNPYEAPPLLNTPIEWWRDYNILTDFPTL